MIDRGITDNHFYSICAAAGRGGFWRLADGDLWLLLATNARTKPPHRSGTRTGTNEAVARFLGNPASSTGTTRPMLESPRSPTENRPRTPPRRSPRVTRAARRAHRPDAQDGRPAPAGVTGAIHSTLSPGPGLPVAATADADAMIVPGYDLLLVGQVGEVPSRPSRR